MGLPQVSRPLIVSSMMYSCAVGLFYGWDAFRRVKFCQTGMADRLFSTTCRYRICMSSPAVLAVGKLQMSHSGCRSDGLYFTYWFVGKYSCGLNTCHTPGVNSFIPIAHLRYVIVLSRLAPLGL